MSLARDDEGVGGGGRVDGSNIDFSSAGLGACWAVRVLLCQSDRGWLGCQRVPYGGLELHLDSSHTSEFAFLLTSASGEESKVPPGRELPLAPHDTVMEENSLHQASFPG